MSTKAGGYNYRSFSPPFEHPSYGGMSFGESIAHWLNEMDTGGWEFVGGVQRIWLDADTQQAWLFRRPR